MSGDRGQEVVAPYDEHDCRLERGDGRRPWHVAEKGDLAESLARAVQDPDGASVDIDLEAAVLDDVVDVATLALADGRAAPVDGQPSGLPRDLLEGGRRQRREHRIARDDPQLAFRDTGPSIDPAQPA